jgi:hypothetical protein
MAVNYQILSSSPAANGFHINGLTGGDTPWKSLSNPAFVILALDSPMSIHHVSLVNAGAAIVEIMGLPSSSPVQGANAKENLYQIILDGTTLANPAEWKAQTNVEGAFEFFEFDDDSVGVVYSQLKITLRGYSSGKAIGMKDLRINAKNAVVRPQSVALPSLALELDSDDEEEALPSLKSNSSSLLQGRLAELKEKMQKEEEAASRMDVDVAPVNLVPSVSYVVKVANEAEFDPEYATKKMVVDEPAKPVVRKERPKTTTAAAPMPPSEHPLSHIVLTVSGIGPERAEVRKTLTDLGGTYLQNLPTSAAPGQLLILLVDASSDQWIDTPKHQQALAQNVSIVDRSWLNACEKKKQFLAVAPYLAQFRTGAGKTKPAPATHNSLAVPAPAKAKKSTIKSEGGSFATDKAAKGDEVESDGPDEYVFDDFVVPDEDEIEYFDDPLDYIDEENFGAFSAHNPLGHGHHANTKKAAPKVSQHNIPAKRIWNANEVQDRWECWLAKCSTMLPGKPITVSKGPNLNAIPKSAAFPKDEVTKFGMDVDDAASDGTNPIEAEELADLNTKDWM